MIPVLQFQRTNPDAHIPTKATAGSANYDLYAPVSVCLFSGDAVMVDLGLRCVVPPGYVLEVYPRSGLARQGIEVVNSPGQIDSDFRGHLKCIVRYIVGYRKSSAVPYVIEKGDRIAQCRLVPVVDFAIAEIDNIPVDTERGTGGYGHSGR